MINVVVLSGNVVKDPTSRTSRNGSPVSNIRLAVDSLTAKDTLFIDVEAWDKTAEFVKKHVKKGSLISVQGKLKLDEWTKEGVTRSVILVSADQINFLTPKKREEFDNSPPAHLLEKAAEVVAGIEQKADLADEELFK
jgi:single-strand DNA-binding protein